MNQRVLVHRVFPEEFVNRLKGFENVLEGVALLPDLQQLIGAGHETPFCKAVQQGQKVEMERRRTDGLNEGCTRLPIRRHQNVSNHRQKAQEIADIVLTGVENPGPELFREQIGVGHLRAFQERRLMGIGVQRVHGHMDRAAP